MMSYPRMRGLVAKKSGFHRPCSMRNLRSKPSGRLTAVTQARYEGESLLSDDRELYPLEPPELARSTCDPGLACGALRRRLYWMGR